MLQNTAAKKYGFGLLNAADFKAKIISNGVGGLQLEIDHQQVHAQLIGTFNAYNLLGIYGAALLLGEESHEVLVQISALKTAPGRFEQLAGSQNKMGIVDYAHTPDALENVLKTIENIRTRNEQVITVVGCGGDRDALKRPEMARIACEMSDKVILTSDNPRTEDPAEILKQMEAGVGAHQTMKVLSILDRDQAIKTAVSLAQAKDIILIAGKGHEKYQDIKGIKHPFDDFEVVKNYFQKLSK